MDIDVILKSRLGTESLRKLQELVRPHKIRVEGIPCLVQNGWPTAARSDTVPPVIPGDEIPAGVAHDAEVEILQLRENVRPPTLIVGLIASGIVQTPVNASPQVFGESTKQPGVDATNTERRMDV